MSLAVCHSNYLCKQVLIVEGDDFDDADFSVQGDPDGVNLEPTIALGLEHLPNPRATRAMDYDNIQKLKPPILRNNSAVPDQAPGPQTPVSGRASSVPSTTNTEYLSKAPNQVNKPQHMLAPPLKASTLASAEQLPSTRLQQNLHLADNVTSNETSSLESSNAPENDSLPIGFFTARAAESLQQGHGLPLKAPAFNPHLDSPSIRKTAGIDRSKSKPVGRDSVTAPPALPRMSFVNPQTDKTRKIGMPASPLLNRGYYKPPQFKRSAEERSVFGDVTNNVGDNKRQRVGSDAQDINHNQGMLNV